MMAGMVEETLEQKLKRHEDALALCIAEITKLRAENERLRSAEGAHDVLRRLYLDETQSSNVRVLAARAALPHESAPLKAQDPPMNLAAEEIIPLSELVEKQRARANWMLLHDEQFTSLPIIVQKPSGSDDSSND
jgi:hypothetical protein